MTPQDTDRGDSPRVPVGTGSDGRATTPPALDRPSLTMLRRAPDCPTCHQPVWLPVMCECGHPLIAHRHDLKVWTCNSGCGVPPLACGCRGFVEAIEGAA